MLRKQKGFSIKYSLYIHRILNTSFSLPSARNGKFHKPDFQKPEMQSTSTADELLKFKALLDSGAITEDEYNTQKNKLLNQ